MRCRVRSTMRASSMREVVLGVLSLIFWALTLSVTIKYVTIMMRADNEGEGGILALFALAQRRLVAGQRVDAPSSWCWRSRARRSSSATR